MASDGRGVSDWGLKRLKIEGSIPGEVVRARVFGREKSTILARALEAETASPDRVEPRCRHFGDCGGCSWQHVAYPRQLELKRALLVEALRERELSFPEIPLPLGVRDPWHYRNKMDFDFSPGPDGLVLGLHRRGSYRTVLDLQECWLQAPQTAEILATVRRLAIDAKLDAYDLKRHEGLLRNLLVLQSKFTGQFLLQVVTSPPEPAQVSELSQLAETVMRLHPEVAGVLHAVHEGRSNISNPEGAGVLLAGRETITERLAGLELEVGPHTFLQRNTEQAERLYATVLDLAGLGAAPSDSAGAATPAPAIPAGAGTLDDALSVDAIDLYCGFGPISQLVAAKVHSVTGIESVPEMIVEARRLAEARGFKNARFLLGTAEELLPSLAAELRPGLVIANPPRAGIHRKALRALVELAAPRVVYVSCSPASLADNLKALVAGGYRLDRVQPVDLFPQTPHLETVVALARG
jgi:tRNA/tmRNA/rRNA uracil-C5-methylase (TrmA/RlmC/RlmD family)